MGVEGRRASSPLRMTFGIGGRTGGPLPLPLPLDGLGADAGTEIGAGAAVTGAAAGAGVAAGASTIDADAGSVRRMRSPEISSSRTAPHVQRMRRAHSSTSGKRMRTWSSCTASVSARTVVAKKARVSVDPAEVAAVAVCPTVAVAVGEDGANEGGGEGGIGRVDEEEDEGAGGGG